MSDSEQGAPPADAGEREGAAPDAEPHGGAAAPGAPDAASRSPMNDDPALPARPPAPAFPPPHLVPLRPLAVRLEADDVLPGLVAIGPVATERKARDWALVLQSMSVWHVIRRSLGGWVLLVRDEDYAAASQSIDHYEAENRDWPPRPTRERSRHATTLTIPVVFALLAAFFLVTGPVSGGSIWFERGIAVSERMLSTQPWRAVTALTLHVDAVHVLGNAISGTVFVSAVQRRIGAGGAALAVLASGVAGNLANAFYHHVNRDPHASLGASTAVFGAIGVLAATQLVLDRGAREAPATGARRWVEAAAPIVGGFALLGELGAGGGLTDLGAHLFGFLAGVLIGLAVAFPLRRSTNAVDMASVQQGHEVALGAGAPRWWVQTTLGAIAAAVVVVSWQLALR